MSIRKQDTELSASLQGEGNDEARSNWAEGCGLWVSSAVPECVGSGWCDRIG